MGSSCALFDNPRPLAVVRPPICCFVLVKGGARTKTGERWSNCAELRAAAVAGFGSKGLPISAAAETACVPWRAVDVCFLRYSASITITMSSTSIAALLQLMMFAIIGAAQHAVAEVEAKGWE